MSIYRLAFGCYLFAIIILFLFGVVYLTSNEFMPYHAEILNSSWQQIDQNIKFLYLVFLKGSGAAMLALSIMMAIVLFVPYRLKKQWSNWAIGITGLLFSLPVLYIVVLIKLETDASPPIVLASLLNLFFIIGFLLTLQHTRKFSVKEISFPQKLSLGSIYEN